MTTSRAYQAGYASVLEKLAVSNAWIRKHVEGGVKTRLGALGKTKDTVERSTQTRAADNTLKQILHPDTPTALAKRKTVEDTLEREFERRSFPKRAAALGVADWLARDKADTEQYMASPEYQALLKAHATQQKAPKHRFDFNTWADGTQRQLDAEATAAGSPR